jgi:SMI1/KNR4 family protein SUKH-1
MNPALEELARLVAPPDPPPTPGDWAAARAKFGFDLPEDYRELIDRYGAGTFDGELRVLVPGHPVESFDLLRTTDQDLWGLRYLREQAGREPPYRPEPVSGGLISWGLTGNGDICYWHVEDEREPAGWTVAVNSPRADEWHSFAGSVTEYLAGLFSGRVRAEFYDGDWPTDAPAFERAP